MEYHSSKCTRDIAVRISIMHGYTHRMRIRTDVFMSRRFLCMGNANQDLHESLEAIFCPVYVSCSKILGLQRCNDHLCVRVTLMLFCSYRCDTLARSGLPRNAHIETTPSLFNMILGGATVMQLTVLYSICTL